MSSDEYDEITDIVYKRCKDQMDGKPMFFIEEFEEENIPNEGENFEERPKKLVTQRKVFNFTLLLSKELKQKIYYTIRKKRRKFFCILKTHFFNKQ